MSVLGQVAIGVLLGVAFWAIGQIVAWWRRTHLPIGPRKRISYAVRAAAGGMPECKDCRWYMKHLGTDERCIEHRMDRIAVVFRRRRHFKKLLADGMSEDAAHEEMNRLVDSKELA